MENTRINNNNNASVELTEEELMDVCGDGLFADDFEAADVSNKESNFVHNFKVLDSTFSQLVFTLSDLQPRRRLTQRG